MSFSFLHAADLHLGSPFTGLTLKDEAVAKRFAAASREAFSSLVETAINAKVAFVVIAGDVYDGEWKDASIGLFFNREVARLERAGIPVFLLKGNHDAESVVTKAISLPDSVHQFPTTKAKTFQIEDIKVALHGRSFPDRAVTENYALAYLPPLRPSLSIGTVEGMLAETFKSEPDIVCLSALPPYAISHARNLYRRIRTQNAELKIIVGLWNYTEDLAKAASEISGGEPAEICTNLAQITLQTSSALVVPSEK